MVITIAVITIIAAILLPVIAHAREKGRAASCLNNYHQLGLAIHLYAQDNDDSTPPNGGSFGGLIADCEPYGTNGNIFTCPDDYDRITEGRAGSYRMASLYQGKPLSCGWIDPYNAGFLAQPTTTVLLYEAEQDFAQAPIVPTYRHSHGTQLLDFDGHAHWMPQGKNVADKDD